jgi:hypothetical protein
MSTSQLQTRVEITLDTQYVQNKPKTTVNVQHNIQRATKPIKFPSIHCPLPLQALPGLRNRSVPEGLVQPEFCVSQNSYFNICTCVHMYACLYF